ncbi:hypothetical protein BCR34DRAFT_499185 [Clohesyomyces aquaticus]|uniref:Uncharacterized protein n=1 Tax=Clohesyomyces aquaticus TaxID=1231657 RepID=A0A1Y1Y981_9PLEO|nr:hypothetical protein BCR34DRAFT_499185 [Clohesyomyces aquaticus]
MSSFLFPISDHPAAARRKMDYAPFMSDIARATSDAGDALNLFKNLIEGTAGGQDSVGFMAFDAHGGDTGCQLRAGMMQEVSIVYRYLLKDVPDTWNTIRGCIDTYTTKLLIVHENAKMACVKLVRDKAHPNKIGLATTEDTPENMLRVLGWDVGSESPSWAARAKISIELGMSDSTPRSRTNIQEFIQQDAVLSTAWDPLSIHNLTRFVIFCYVLSKYKVFAIIHGTIGARLAPEDAAEVSYSFIRPYTDKKKRPGKPQRTLRELAELQSWLSDMSCAWLRSLALRARYSEDMERCCRLVMSTLQQSDKGLLAMACYPGYLLAREMWASMKCTLLLIDRHFCDHDGFHYNIFVAHLQPPTSACPCHLHPLGLQVTWKVTKTSLESLIDDSDTIQPHIVIMGNSINGGHNEYMQRFAKKVRVHDSPRENPCTDNEMHIQALLAADHDRLALSFFATHKAYAFLVPGANHGNGNENDNDHSETAFVDQGIDMWASSAGIYASDMSRENATTLKESWRTSKGESDAMGTGAGGMHIFAWQHAFLETKGRVARRIKKWAEVGDMMPLHAPIS